MSPQGYEKMTLHCPHCRKPIDTVDLISSGTVTDPLVLETGIKMLIDGSCSSCNQPLHSVWILQEVEIGIPSLYTREE